MHTSPLVLPPSLPLSLPLPLESSGHGHSLPRHAISTGTHSTPHVASYVMPSTPQAGKYAPSMQSQSTPAVSDALPPSSAGVVSPPSTPPVVVGHSTKVHPH